MSNSILFHSTNDPNHAQAGLDFADALMQGLAPDKGLYMMDRDQLPRLGKAEWDSLSAQTYPEIAARILRPFVTGRIPDERLMAICADAYDYETPIEEYGPGRYLMRLDRGPTASFKDYAARLMARFMSFFLAESERELTILTATSGDTGGAVAAAFHGLPRIRVVVLFPGAEVSERQRRQMTTLGGNVYAVNVDGKFDDCQAMVKHAFVDPALQTMDLTSANSINVGRLLPQSVYYMYAASRIGPTPPDRPLRIIVPSGNFGNLMGGLLAWNMGMPAAGFVAAVNENDEFPLFLRTNHYAPVSPSRNCLSNAMNVGHPSNLARLIRLYGGAMDETGALSQAPDMEAMHHDILSVEITDAETRAAIREAYERFGIVIEPHGAVGYMAIEKLGLSDQYTTLLVETAHPAKFPEIVTEMIGVDPELPEAMRAQAAMEEQALTCPARYPDFKALLLDLSENW